MVQTFIAAKSGVADHYAENDEHALLLARKTVLYCHKDKAVPNPRIESQEPLYPASELSGIIPADAKQAVPMHEIIARIVDGSEFDEY